MLWREKAMGEDGDLSTGGEGDAAYHHAERTALTKAESVQECGGPPFAKLSGVGGCCPEKQRGYGCKIATDDSGGEYETMEDDGPDDPEAGPEAEGDEEEEDSCDRTAITLELLSQGGFYDMPMAKAARLLGRTEGSFQRVCRGLGILRWPYRVRKSLQAIMAKTEQYLDDSAQEDGMSKAEVLKVLQAHMDDIKGHLDDMQGIAGSGMDKATKQYRQYIFKLNHKLGRKAGKDGPDMPSSSAVKVKGMLKAASRIQKTRRKGPSEAGRCGAAAPAAQAASEVPLTRPTPRRFEDLPSSLAISREQGDIMGAMATAAVHSRLTTSVSSIEERLMRVCQEMDGLMQKALQGMLLQEPLASQQLSDIARVDPYIARILSAQMGIGQPILFPGAYQEPARGYLPFWPPTM